jgi:hypothetical protein
MQFHISMTPQGMIDEYNLTDIMEADGWCYVEIRKAMYGLKESGFIANQELKVVPAKHGYIPSKSTLGHSPTRLFLNASRRCALAQNSLKYEEFF